MSADIIITGKKESGLPDWIPKESVDKLDKIAFCKEELGALLTTTLPEVKITDEDSTASPLGERIAGY